MPDDVHPGAAPAPVDPGAAPAPVDPGAAPAPVDRVASDAGATPPDRVGELGAVVIAGHRGDEPRARAALDARDPAVRVAALGALDRMGRLGRDELCAALTDVDRRVRARACELAVAARDVALLDVLHDPDPAVVEVAAWACGERWAAEPAAAQSAGENDGPGDPDDVDDADDIGDAHDVDEPSGVSDVDDVDDVVTRLIELGRNADDQLVREAAIAALGSIGDERGRDVTVTAARGDRPAVRRRAVVALAAYDGDDVVAALRAATDDRDWQVRAAAEDLLRTIGDPVGTAHRPTGE